MDFCGLLWHNKAILACQDDIMTIRKDVTVRSRVSPGLKKQAESVLAAIGMSSSEAIRLFFQQIANRKEFPLELKVPNQQTLDAFNEESPEPVTIQELRDM